MEITREVRLDAPADEVWELLTDPDELAGWVGDEVRLARFAAPDVERRRIGWTWDDDGVEAEVEIALEEAGAGSLVRVVERTTAPAGARWTNRALDLEYRCLVRSWASCIV